MTNTIVPVPQGGTGLTTTTAYAVVCGGTTSTGALQSIAGVGTSGQVLTSNGASALPTFQANNAKVRTIGFSTTSAATGQQGSYVVFPVAGTITGWSIVANAGTATVTTWKIASGTAAPTVSNSISTSGVALSTGTAIISSTTSDFTTTTVSANDIFAFNISAVSGVTQLEFQLQITVT